MNGAGLGSARATMTTDTSTSRRLVREGGEGSCRRGMRLSCARK